MTGASWVTVGHLPPPPPQWIVSDWERGAAYPTNWGGGSPVTDPAHQQVAAAHCWHFWVHCWHFQPWGDHFSWHPHSPARAIRRPLALPPAPPHPEIITGGVPALSGGAPAPPCVITGWEKAFDTAKRHIFTLSTICQFCPSRLSAVHWQNYLPVYVYNIITWSGSTTIQIMNHLTVLLLFIGSYHDQKLPL